MEARNPIVFPESDEEDSFVFGNVLVTLPPAPHLPHTTPRRRRRPILATAPTRVPPHTTTSTSRLPKFPFSTQGELSGGHEPPLSTTALVFVGLSAFILFAVAVAGVYFWCKSKRFFNHLHSKGSLSASVKARFTPKGRGVTRPSFLPSQAHKLNPNGADASTGKSVRHHAVPESFHLEIPSPEEWTQPNYPIKTPYSFASTSTFASEQEQEPQKSNQHIPVKQIPVPMPMKRIRPQVTQPQPNEVNQFKLQPVPVKPARSRANGVNVVAPELGMSDQLPTHRITVY